ncbi:MAG: zinc-ribbon domain-containing protein [Clostridia bacterium]|nr:zinc-ribbon domain-containing protein [Clostridia bacterium]
MEKSKKALFIVSGILFTLLALWSFIGLIEVLRLLWDDFFYLFLPKLFTIVGYVFLLLAAFSKKKILLLLGCVFYFAGGVLAPIVVLIQATIASFQITVDYSSFILSFVFLALLFAAFSLRNKTIPCIVTAVVSIAIQFFLFIRTSTFQYPSPILFLPNFISFVAFALLTIAVILSALSPENAESDEDIVKKYAPISPLTNAATPEAYEPFAPSKAPMSDLKTHFCPYCGKKVAENSHFCSNCGKKL